MLKFTEFLNEGRGFEWNGSKYSSGFGRYTKDGKSISKEEYMKASAEYKGDKPLPTNTTTNTAIKFSSKVTKKDIENRESAPETKIKGIGRIRYSIPMKNGIKNGEYDSSEFCSNRFSKYLNQLPSVKDANIEDFKKYSSDILEKHMNEFLDTALMTAKEKKAFKKEIVDSANDYIGDKWRDLIDEWMVNKRTFEPKIKKSSKGFKITVPVHKETFGKDKDTLDISFDNMEEWYKKYADIVSSNKPLFRDEPYKPDRTGFKGYVKNTIGGKVEDIMRTAMMTQKERWDIYDEFVDAAFNYIDKHFKHIPEHEK